MYQLRTARQTSVDEDFLNSAMLQAGPVPMCTAPAASTLIRAMPEFTCPERPGTEQGKLMP